MRGEGWGRGFDADRLARLELRMWKAYYRRQPLRLFGLLVLANREQAGVGWVRAVAAAARLARGAAAFGRSSGDYEQFLPDIVGGYRALGLPDDVDAAEVARRELRWWVVRREIGLAAGRAAGEAIAELYAAIYGLPTAAVADAGRLRGEAAEVRDRGATADPDGPAGAGRAYWPEVARLLRASYRSLRAALDAAPRPDDDAAGPLDAGTSSAYQFVTRWVVPADREEVAAVLGDAGSLARWWPSVYLRVTELDPGDERGIGKVVDLWTKGWLPYTLRWRFRVTESDPPNGFALEASGDFVGRGVWRLAEAEAPGGPNPAGVEVPDGPGPARDGAPPIGIVPWTLVEYDWRIVAEKGLLRRLSFLLRPVFAANHRWAMARGEESLRLEIARRHAADDPAIVAALPAPPGPTFTMPRRRPGP